MSHGEWFPFANTVALLLCLIATSAAAAVLRLPLLAQTEEQLTSLIALRHSSVEPAHLPLKFLFLYVVVALDLFCLCVGAVLIGTTTVSLVWGSGPFYRAIGVLFPALVAVVSFVCGFGAIKVAAMLKARSFSLATVTVAVAGLCWGLTVIGVAIDMWLWKARFLPLLSTLGLATVFVVCCLIMWSGAFVARWVVSARAHILAPNAV